MGPFYRYCRFAGCFLVLLRLYWFEELSRDPLSVVAVRVHFAVTGANPDTPERKELIAFRDTSRTGAGVGPASFAFERRTCPVELMD